MKGIPGMCSVFSIACTGTTEMWIWNWLHTPQSRFYPNTADMLKAYSSGQVRLLKAIAKEGCVKEVLAGDFISAYRLRAASSVSAALKKLLENELVYQTADGYMIYDRFMGEWLRRQGF